MTVQEFSDRMHTLHGLVHDNFAVAALSKPAEFLHLSIKNRITKEGKNSADAPIGQYSTKAAYYKPGQFAKAGSFNAQGKNSKFGNTIGDKLIPSVRLISNSRKANPTSYEKYTLVKPDYTVRKTMYLPMGYKELRDIQGLRTDIVNLQYRGVMMGDYQVGVNGQSIVLGFSTLVQSLKRQYMEKKFGAVFQPTRKEIQRYNEDANFNLMRLTRGVLTGTETINATIQ